MSASQDMVDSVNTRAMQLVRYEGSLFTASRETLKALQADIIALLSTRLNTQDQAALNQLLAEIRERIRARYSTINQQLTDELNQLSDATATWITNEMSVATGIPESLILLYFLPRDQVVTIRGVPLQEWLGRQAQSLQNRVTDQVRMGASIDATEAAIIQMVRGTRANNYADGAFSRSINEVRSIITTAVQHVNQSVLVGTYQQNPDVVRYIQWQSILDNRTTQICIARDNKLYTLDGEPVGHGLPWLGGPGNAHFGCRSSGIPVFRRWNETNIQPTDKMRQSMDGEVPASMSYEDWLRGKSEAFQNEVLGKGKADLWRQGRISIRDMVSNAGRPLTLEQLKRL